MSATCTTLTYTSGLVCWLDHNASPRSWHGAFGATESQSGFETGLALPGVFDDRSRHGPFRADVLQARVQTGLTPLVVFDGSCGHEIVFDDHIQSGVQTRLALFGHDHGDALEAEIQVGRTFLEAGSFERTCGRTAGTASPSSKTFSTKAPCSRDVMIPGPTALSSRSM